MPSFFSRLKTIVGQKEKRPKVEKVRREEVKEEVKKRVPQETTSDKFQIRAQEILLEAQNEAFKIRKEAEEEARRVRNEVLLLQQRLTQKEESLERRITSLEEKENHLRSKEDELKNKISEIEKVKQEQLAKLERAAGLTSEEAKKLILDSLDNYLREEKAKRIKEAEAQAKEEASKKAREILADAMLHGATDYVAEYTVSTIKLADEEIKGRIIGKEGRNIKALEQATGVDFDIDETPGEIRLSSFDPVRREIAKVSLERLIADGRIQPARIEEMVAKTKKDIEKIMFEEGEKLCHAVGVYNLPADKVSLLGRFKYRFSYGQNMIAHTLEETQIGIALARELGAEVNVVRLGCLLHDIGKVITDEEGSHVQLAVDLLRKNNMPPKVIACVEEHHEDKPFSSLESVLVYIADAISGARPGARLEDYGEYIKRLTDLEAIAQKQQGVVGAYAFQAGRELRVIVDPGKVDDATAIILSKTIKDEIEKQLTYPGQIKVTVIRELRATEVAK
ncbi:ribonuclease Y [Candidatus Microgenomates bacterium]|nr:ribonuclease Y [Candidatus Microgenomates bacterium]